MEEIKENKMGTMPEGRLLFSMSLPMMISMLVQAMYKDEKPFLIFDDPFVNLDDNNIQGGMRLLNEIAKDYQVIYFTCSESRINN